MSNTHIAAQARELAKKLVAHADKYGPPMHTGETVAMLDQCAQALEAAGLGQQGEATDEQQKGGARKPEDEMVRYCPECGRIGPVPKIYQACCPDSFGMNVRRWQAEKMERILDRLRAMLSPRAAPALDAQGEPASTAPEDCDALCPRCEGSGEETGWSDNGPDAHEVTFNCRHCDGKGTLYGAYVGLVAELEKQRKAYLKACGDLYFAKHLSPSPQAPLESKPPLSLDAIQAWAKRRASALGPEGVTDPIAFLEEGVRWGEAQHGIGVKESTNG